MTNDQQPWVRTETKKKESFFVGRMQRIVDQTSMIVKKDGLGFLKGNPIMLSLVEQVLFRIPSKSQEWHTYSICTLTQEGKSRSDDDLVFQNLIVWWKLRGGFWIERSGRGQNFKIPGQNVLARRRTDFVAD